MQCGTNSAVAALRLPLIFAAFSALVPCSASGAPREDHDRGRRLNVLLIGLDDLRLNLGAYSTAPQLPFPRSAVKRMRTPWTNRLARDSLLFQRAYVQQPLCNPSRVATLTSRRPDTTGVDSNQNHKHFREILKKKPMTLLPEFFRQLGYFTAGVGKITHMDMTEFWDWQYEFLPYIPEVKRFRNASECQERKDPAGEQQCPDSANTGELGRIFSNISSLTDGGKRPFFLALGLHKPHTPLVTPTRFVDMYPMEETANNQHPPVDYPFAGQRWLANATLMSDALRRRTQHYYASVSFADHQVGRAVRQLKLSGHYEDTVVALWVDHGFHLGENGFWSGKETPFEVDTRVPMMLRVPGLTDGGLATGKLVENVDLFPTLVEAATGLVLPTCPEDRHERLCTEGSSLMPLVRDPVLAPWKDAAFWQTLRGGVLSSSPPGSPARTYLAKSIRTARFRFTEYVDVSPDLGTGYYGSSRWDGFDWTALPVAASELYDHLADPMENRNVAKLGEYRPAARALSRKLRGGWREALERLKKRAKDLRTFSLGRNGSGTVWSAAYFFKLLAYCCDPVAPFSTKDRTVN